MDSTPGVPLAAVGKDNKDLIQFLGHDIIAKLIYDRIKLLIACGPLGSTVDPAHLVEECLVDAVRVFVKQEPHKWSKIVNERWRLICSVSTIDSAVERALYTKRNALEIKCWSEIPSKPGMGASNPDLETLADILENLLKRGDLLDSDVSGWDWRRRKWQAFARIYALALWFDVEPESDLFLCMWNREVCATNAVFAFSDGMLASLEIPGIMLSGRYVTSSGNSAERVLGSCLAGTDAIAMGDDCTETLNGVPEQVVIERYNSMGYEGIVEYRTTRSVEDTIFCSLRFYRDGEYWRAEPVNWIRTLFRYVSKGKGKVSWAEFHQFCHEIRHLRQDTTKLIQDLLSYVDQSGVSAST